MSWIINSSTNNEVFSYYAISFADNDTFLERIITWLARDDL